MRFPLRGTCALEPHHSCKFLRGRYERQQKVTQLQKHRLTIVLEAAAFSEDERNKIRRGEILVGRGGRTLGMTEMMTESDEDENDLGKT